MDTKPSYFYDNYTGRKEVTDSTRILCTPSFFARSTLLYIQEIGKLKSLKGHVSQRERLDSYLFLLVLSGQGTLTYGNHIYQLNAGNLAFIDCNRSYAHQCSDERPWELMWVHFNGSQMGRYYTYYTQKYTVPVFFSSNPSFYIDLIEQIMSIADDNSDISELNIAHLLNALVTRILTKSDNPELLPSAAEKIYAVKTFIDGHFHQSLSLDLLAKQFYISKYHMAREFKKTYGATIVSYILKKRITHAKGLLRFTNLQIEKIAAACGIEDSSYFNRVFHKTEGVSAREYRKMWRGNDKSRARAAQNDPGGREPGAGAEDTNP